MEKIFVNIQYDYTTNDMVATFQTKTDNGDGTTTYGSYDATMSELEKTTILNILNPL